MGWTEISKRGHRIHSGSRTSPTCPRVPVFLYLAVLLDVFSRRLVGWSMAGHVRTELVLNALDMAIRSRQPESFIHHSDQGCQYTTLAFGQRCHEAGVGQSMGSVGIATTTPWRRFFRHLQMRIDRPPVLPEPLGGQAGNPRVHRGLVQPEAAPFRRRPPGPEGL